jgi:hypothetical protein
MWIQLWYIIMLLCEGLKHSTEDGHADLQESSVFAKKPYRTTNFYLVNEYKYATNYRCHHYLIINLL